MAAKLPFTEPEAEGPSEAHSPVSAALAGSQVTLIANGWSENQKASKPVCAQAVLVRGVHRLHTRCFPRDAESKARTRPTSPYCHSIWL